MGVFIWVIVGIVAATVIRLVLALTHHDSWKPSYFLAFLGALLGGFMLDLTIKGDSVTHFQGPSVLGAVVGALLVLGLSFVIVWLGAVRRHDVSHT